MEDTEEELELNIMKDTGMSYEEILQMKITTVKIYQLIKLKESFLNWYMSRPEESI